MRDQEAHVFVADLNWSWTVHPGHAGFPPTLQKTDRPIQARIHRAPLTLTALTLAYRAALQQMRYHSKRCEGFAGFSAISHY